MHHPRFVTWDTTSSRRLSLDVTLVHPRFRMNVPSCDGLQQEEEMSMEEPVAVQQEPVFKCH